MLYDFSYFFLLFIIYSFLGWIIETIDVYVETKKLVNRGFLMGPYCPIYGVGSLIMLFILSKYKDDPFNLYVMFVVYASILEYVTSYLMEKLFNARWWDYSNIKFNLNGRICLANCLSFGLLGLFLGYFLNPLIVRMLSAMPVNILYIISIGIAVIFVIDVCITFNVVTKLKKNFVLINKDMTGDINKQIAKFIENNRIVKAFPMLKQKINRLVRNKKSL